MEDKVSIGAMKDKISFRNIRDKNMGLVGNNSFNAMQKYKLVQCRSMKDKTSGINDRNRPTNLNGRFRSMMYGKCQVERSF
jgi:hypothetical protein